MSDPFFSVIIPTYNRASFITRTIQSVLDQTFPRFEVIVIDDGSSDNTESVVKTITDSRVRYIKKENGERGAARNEGTRMSKGQFVNFLDSDDLLYPHHLATAFYLIEKNNNLRVFHLGFDIKDIETGKVLRDSSNVGDVNRQILSGSILAVSGVFIHRDIALQNLFNEDRRLSSIEDWELWIRLAARYKIVHYPAITSTVVNHEGRSVMSVDVEHIKVKTALFRELISGNEEMQRRYGKAIDKILASAFTYCSLHLAIAKAPRAEIAGYLLNGLRMNPGEIFTKRFLVILKLLVLR